MHNRGNPPPLFSMCWLQWGRAWEIQALGVSFEVPWSQSLGDYIVGGSDAVRLEWGAGTCGLLP